MTSDERDAMIARAMERLAKLREREALVPPDPPKPPGIVKPGGQPGSWTIA